MLLIKKIVVASTRDVAFLHLFVAMNVGVRELAIFGEKNFHSQ